MKLLYLCSVFKIKQDNKTTTINSNNKNRNRNENNKNNQRY